MFSEINEYYSDLLKEADGSLPFKSAIHPQKISSLLPWFVIIEQNEEKCYTVRLAGTNVDKTLGQSLTKSNLLTKYQEEEWPLILSFFEKIKTTKCGGYFLQTMTGDGGQEFLNHYMLFPFMDKDGDIKYWAGIIDFEPYNNAVVKIEKTFKPGTLELTAIDIGFGVPEGENEFDKTLLYA